MKKPRQPEVNLPTLPRQAPTTGRIVKTNFDGSQIVETGGRKLVALPPSTLRGARDGEQVLITFLASGDIGHLSRRPINGKKNN